MFSQPEMLVLTAALNPDADVAVRSWREWAAIESLEDAPSPQVRLLPTVLENLSRIAPAVELPKKVYGLARMTFAKSRHLVFSTSDVITQLSKSGPLIVTKGLAMLTRFDSWSSRQMGDIDIHVPRSEVGAALDILATAGWKPRFSMTYESLRHRSSLRRDSWNFRKGAGQVDLHWQWSAARKDDDLEAEMWQTAVQVQIAGQKVLLQSAEYALVTALHHGFLQGNRSDALQSVVDAARLMPLCNDETLLRLLARTNLLLQAEHLMNSLRAAGAPVKIPAVVGQVEMSRRTPLSSTPLPDETALLRRPSLYRLWEKLGRRSRLEHFLLKRTGPFSKPLTPHPPRPEYDLRDCAMMDEIAGPGWSWPEPDRSCFWSDRGDARLLIPLQTVDDHLIILSMEGRTSLNAEVDIFANGVFIVRWHQMARLASGACCLMIPGRLLFGPWIEISLRPRPYLGASEDGATALGVPARRLRVLNLRQITEVFSRHEVPQLYVRILKGEEPYASKFARIEDKISNSPFKNSEHVPVNFDPFMYVLSYPDLFENEVDPYVHFLSDGHRERRTYY